MNITPNQQSIKQNKTNKNFILLIEIATYDQGDCKLTAVIYLIHNTCQIKFKTRIILLIKTQVMNHNKILSKILII